MMEFILKTTDEAKQKEEKELKAAKDKIAQLEAYRQAKEDACQSSIEEWLSFPAEESSFPTKSVYFQYFILGGQFILSKCYT